MPANVTGAIRTLSIGKTQKEYSPLLISPPLWGGSVLFLPPPLWGRVGSFSPSPLWGRVGVGGRDFSPTPYPFPTRGREMIGLSPPCGEGRFFFSPPCGEGRFFFSLPPC